jgi:hypothetical protein
MSYIPRESVEFVPVVVTKGGVAITTGVTFALAVAGARPVTFTTPTTLGAQIGIMTTGSLATGSWTVWAKIVDSPETPVVEAGSFTIT